MSLTDQFKKSLAVFKANNNKAMNAARECSELALRHFYDTGSTHLIMAFRDAMVENWNRAPAFIQWVRDHAPIKKGKDKDVLVKDTVRAATLWPNEKAKAELLERALSLPFWQYSPDQQKVVWSLDKTIIEPLLRIVKNASDEDRYTPEEIEAHKPDIQAVARMAECIRAGKHHLIPEQQAA